MSTGQFKELLEKAADIALRWLKKTGPQLETKKLELIVFTNHKIRNITTITVGGDRIKKWVKYLGVHLL